MNTDFGRMDGLVGRLPCPLPGRREGGRLAVAKYRVARQDQLAPGDLVRVEVDGHALCLARTDAGGFFAVDDTCTNEEESLSEGTVVGREVECPLHLARFDLSSGQPTALPATRCLRTYPVRLDGEYVVVELSRLEREEAKSTGAEN
jgi:3-phenylpropionate/trans-cinnamate dioxygenase ferredoxin subunit